MLLNGSSVAKRFRNYHRLTAKPSTAMEYDLAGLE